MSSPSLCQVERRFHSQGIEPPISSFKFRYLSTIIQQFKVVSDHVLTSSEFLSHSFEVYSIHSSRMIGISPVVIGEILGMIG